MLGKGYKLIAKFCVSKTGNIVMDIPYAMDEALSVGT